MDTKLVKKHGSPRANNLKSSFISAALAIFHLLPFEKVSSDNVQHVLWPGGGRNRDAGADEWSGFRNRGNYVKGYIHSNLRIQAKSARLRVSWNLEGMWDRFPAELICSIYSLLHPIDLYHAIQATKGLRCFLLDKHSSFIWKESFLNHPDIPFYPDDVSASKWASLIFGPASCDSCGKDNCLVEYALRSRKCATCKDYHRRHTRTDNTLYEAIRPIIGDFYGQLDDIWALAFKIRRSGSFTYPRYGSDYIYYSLEQIVGLATDMRKYLLEVQSGAPESKSKYDAYINATIAVAAEREKHTQLCYSWARDIEQRSFTAFRNSVPAFCKMIEKALWKRGHHKKDVANAIKSFAQSLGKEFNFATVGWAAVPDPLLNKSKLSKYLPRIEPLVDSFRMARLRQERAEIIYKRTNEVTSFYNHVTRTMLPHQVKNQYVHQDDIALACKLESFSEYINNPAESFIPLDRGAAQPEILRFLDARLTAKKHGLYILLLEKGLLPQEAIKDSQPDRYLELATAVFQCPSCGLALVGCEEAFAHGHLDIKDYSWRVQETFEFCDRGYQTLQNVVNTLRLGSDSLQTLTQNDLDVLNKRFICKTCHIWRKGGTFGLKALTWRECLRHAKKYEKHVPIFDILIEPMTTHLLACEEHFPPSSEPIWGCLHCVSDGGPLTKAKIIHHNCEVHNISNPVRSVDYSFVLTGNFPRRTPFFIGLDANANHRCLRCPPGTHKLWLNKNRDLYRHLWDAHNIKSDDLVENEDWEKVKTVEDDSWILEDLKDRNDRIVHRSTAD